MNTTFRVLLSLPKLFIIAVLASAVLVSVVPTLLLVILLRVFLAACDSEK